MTPLEELRGLLGNFEGPVGNGRRNAPEDVERMKNRLNFNGFLDAPENGFSPIWDRDADNAVFAFQEDNGLRVDGFARPGGQTDKALQETTIQRFQTFAQDDSDDDSDEGEREENQEQRDKEQRCAQLQHALTERAAELGNMKLRLDSLQQRAERLKDRIEDEAETASADNAEKAFKIVVALASIIPAVRAVRTGIAAARAATTVAKAINAGESLGNALLAVSGLSLLGLDFLKPETKDQLSDVQNEISEIKDKLETTTESYINVAQNLEEEGCNAISI